MAITPYGSYLKKSQQAIETDSDITPMMPYGPGESIPQGGIARPWTGPRPWKKLMNNSTEGSPAFSKEELKQGYRKVGK